MRVRECSAAPPLSSGVAALPVKWFAGLGLEALYKLCLSDYNKDLGP